MQTNGGSYRTRPPPLDSPSYDLSYDAATDPSAVGDLYHLCSLQSWDSVRRWFRNHNVDEAQKGAEFQGEINTTPLHFACKNSPPADVIEQLLAAAPDTVRARQRSALFSFQEDDPFHVRRATNTGFL